MSPTCIFIDISIRHFSVLCSFLAFLPHFHHTTLHRNTSHQDSNPCNETGALDQLSHLDFVVTFFQNKFKCLSVLVLRKPLNCSLQPHIFRPIPIILFVSRNTPLVLFIKKIKKIKS